MRFVYEEVLHELDPSAENGEEQEGFEGLDGTGKPWLELRRAPSALHRAYVQFDISGLPSGITITPAVTSTARTH